MNAFEESVHHYVFPFCRIHLIETTKKQIRVGGERSERQRDAARKTVMVG